MLSVAHHHRAQFTARLEAPEEHGAEIVLAS